MSVQHAIVALPTLDAAEQIEAIRRRFDPLANVLDAHITLVFPFKSAEGAEVLRGHLCATVGDAAPFALELAPPSVEDGGYLSLNVTHGTQHCVQLHDSLYSGILAPHLSPRHTYRPHVTLGRLATSGHLMRAAVEARERITLPLTGRVETIALFRLEDGSQGVAEFNLVLGRSRSHD